MKYYKLRDVKDPVRANPWDAGIDFYIPNDFPETIVYPGSDVKIPSGLIVIVPKGYSLILHNKSGIATNFRLILGAHVVDYGYTGELIIHLINVGSDPVVLKPGMKIVQGILFAISTEQMEEIKNKETLDYIINQLETSRFSGGFGSTGI